MLNESIRRDMDTVEISLSSELFLCQLFGKPMLHTRGMKRQNRWKEILVKITSVLEKAIHNNMVSDGFHKMQMDRYVENLQDASKSKYNTDPEIILSLTAIILELLGGIPNYSGRRGLNRKSDYFLNNLRTLQYYQTPYQKFCTILESSKYEPYANYHSYDVLSQKYYAEYNGNPNGFIKWYKNKYPEVYLELF